jgi:exonuclease VII large subunit
MALNKNFMEGLNKVIEAIGGKPIPKEIEPLFEKVLKVMIGGVAQEVVIRLQKDSAKAANIQTESDNNSPKPTNGKTDYYDYWAGKIQEEFSTLTKEEYEQLKNYLKQNNALYSRNSTEKQLKRTFALIKRWKEEQQTAPHEIEPLSEVDDNDDYGEPPF